MGERKKRRKGKGWIWRKWRIEYDRNEKKIRRMIVMNYINEGSKNKNMKRNEKKSGVERIEEVKEIFKMDVEGKGVMEVVEE